MSKAVPLRVSTRASEEMGSCNIGALIIRIGFWGPLRFRVYGLGFRVLGPIIL